MRATLGAPCPRPRSPGFLTVPPLKFPFGKEQQHHFFAVFFPLLFRTRPPALFSSDRATDQASLGSVRASESRGAQGVAWELARARELGKEDRLFAFALAATSQRQHGLL